MSVQTGPTLVRDGLVFFLDAANHRSYVSGSTQWIDLIGDNNAALTTGTGYDPGNAGSITFDGVDDYVQLSEKLFAGAEDFSIAITFKNTNKNYTFYGGPLYAEWTTGGGTDNNAIISLSQGNSAASSTPYNIRFTCQINNTFYVISSNRVAQLNKITHITVTRSGTDVKLYFNGQLDASGSIAADPIDDRTNNPLIGNAGFGADYKGSIYNIYKYNRSLTAAEVATNYNSLREKINIPPPRPRPEFIMLVKTDNAGISDQFTIPTTGTGYNYTVDWGDGNTDTGVTGGITHTYAIAGTYTVKISGAFPRIYFIGGSGDRLKLLEVQNWGNIAWSNMSYAFYNCSNMDVTAQDTPDLSGVTTITNMFYGCSSLVGNSSFNNWNTKSVTSTSSTFQNCTLFNQPLNNWNTSNVTNMSYTFAGAPNFTGDISTWDVSNVTNISYMFRDASNFNSNISSWDVSSVGGTNMQAMFNGAASFNQPIGSWNVSGVTSMNSVFRGATRFNQDIGAWDISNATDLIRMFFQATAFNNGGSNSINNWNTSAVTNLTATFREASNFNQDISSWDVSNVTNMFECFGHVNVTPNSFNQNLSAWQLRTAGVNLRTIFYRSSMSTANYTDTIVAWANQVFTNGGPLSVDMSLQGSRVYDTSRSGGANFATAGDARTYLTTTAGWTISGDSVI